MRYADQLAAVVDRLNTINPDRVVTRHWTDFANQKQPDLQKGVWLLRPAGVARYPYEVSDNQDPSSSLRATEHGHFRFVLVGRLLLPVDCTGQDVDDAEFELISELEQLADEAMDTEGLQALLLKEVRQSQQVELPYAWVMSTWEVIPLE